jgi:anthranilate phosphoribosyltransferase
MITEAIHKLVDKQDLTYQEAYDTINEVMSGETSQVQTAAFLAALSTKSTKAETIDEISGCAAAMRSHATPVEYAGDTLEIVGTGGDKASSFNISTTASMVIAAGGVKVAKHGNRAASSKSGAADCLEALGVNIEQSPEKCCELLDGPGICFLFAQKYHAAMKYVGPIRKELGIRTVFNILGPLTNPAAPSYMVLGVYDGALVEPLARVLVSLGVKRGMVVYGECVLDELSTACDTRVCEFRCEGGAAAGTAGGGEADGAEYLTYTLTPEQFGMARCTRDDLRGGDPADNAKITRDILASTDRGCRRDTVVLNAAAGLYVGGAVASLKEGVERAAELIDSGAAAATLDAYVAASNQ